MKRLAYLINTFFIIIFSKSGVFANELESEISYLLELGKNNISQADRLVFLLTLLTGFFAVAFISIIGFIVFKLIDLSKQISTNKEVLETIKEHGDRLSTFGDKLTTLAGETTEIRDQIRDQNLMAKGITDKHYGNLLEEVLQMEASPTNMNMIRNLVWTLFKPEQYESGLKRLRAIFGDSATPSLMEKIKRVYFENLKETIPKRKLLTWVYEIRENKKEINDLIREELKNKIKIEKERIEFWKTLPPLYPEREKSTLEVVLEAALKEKEKKSPK